MNISCVGQKGIRAISLFFIYFYYTSLRNSIDMESTTCRHLYSGSMSLIKIIARVTCFGVDMDALNNERNLLEFTLPPPLLRLSLPLSQSLSLPRPSLSLSLSLSLSPSIYLSISFNELKYPNHHLRPLKCQAQLNFPLKTTKSLYSFNYHSHFHCNRDSQNCLKLKNQSFLY